MNSTLSIIMEPRIHEAATDLAAGRTAYSLAREVLGLRAQVAELRQELNLLHEIRAENETKCAIFESKIRELIDRRKGGA